MKNFFHSLLYGKRKQAPEPPAQTEATIDGALARWKERRLQQQQQAERNKELSPATKQVYTFVSESFAFWLDKTEQLMASEPVEAAVMMKLSLDLAYLYLVHADVSDPTGQLRFAAKGADWLAVAKYLLDTVKQLQFKAQVEGHWLKEFLDEQAEQGKE